MQQNVFFIRGLFTSGGDNVRLPLIDFGPVHRRLQSALESHGLRFHPVLGLGVGSLSETAARAAAFLDQHPVWTDERQTVHLLGHSAGGLVTRLLLPGLKRPVASALTVATPHKGTGLADLALNLPERNRGSHLLLRSMGWNVSKRSQFYQEYTPSGVAQLFRRTEDSRRPNMVGRLGSIVCSAPRSEWCLPLKMFYKIKAFDDYTTPSDGIVDRDSQPFGHVVSEISIDHIRQVGLFDRDRRFEQLTQSIAGFFKG